MWGVVLYCLAVFVGLFLFMAYEPKEEKECDHEEAGRKARPRPKKADYRFSSLFNVLGISLEPEEEENFEAFREHFHCFETVSDACFKAGLERVSLIIGVDFTASNEWQGRKSFGHNCLHKTSGSKVYNPYQKVIWILGQTLAPFADEDLIPTFGFGDSITCDEEVFPFNEDESPCRGFQDVLDRYNDVVKGITLGGPTSFAPVIAKAIELVKQTHKYHILVIVADGQVTEEGPTIDAIVEASKHPISIIVVGVGDGPWDIMEEFDHRLPKRKFDNFRFVNYHKAIHKAKNPDAVFALQALMEIPDQYKCIKSLGYLQDSMDSTSVKSMGVDPMHVGSIISSKFSLKKQCAGRSSPFSTPSNSPRHSLYSTSSDCTPRHRILSSTVSTPV